MVTGTELYKEIVKELRRYDKALTADREAYKRETDTEYRKSLNPSGLAKSRTNAAEIEHRMKKKSDDLRQGIATLLDSAINENYPKETLKAADLDSGLVSMLNAGFILDTERLGELYSQYDNFTCHQLIRDYAKKNNVILAVDEDRNEYLARQDRDNFDAVMLTYAMSDKVIDATGAKAMFIRLFGIDQARADAIEGEADKELRLESLNREYGYIS